MITDKIRLVLWRNLRLRRYHYVITVLEILMPIIVFYQGLVFYQLFLHNSQQRNATIYPKISETELFNIFEQSFVTLLYTPKSDFTDRIMELVDRTIKAKQIFALDDEDFLEMILANETFVEEHRTKFKWTVFGIVFLNSEEADGKTFEYKIRTPTFLLSKDTRQLYSDIYSPPADVDDEYITSGFLGLQYAVDKSFIEIGRTTLENQLPKISIQRFPYPEFVEEQFPEDIIYFLTLIGFIFLALTLPHYIAVERHSGMKELMKTMGLNEWLLWFGWLSYSLMIYPIIITIITILLTANISVKPFYENISPMLIWIMFMLYCIANLTFLFAVGTLFNKHWVAVIISVVTWFLTSSQWLISMTISTTNCAVQIVPTLLLCFLPNLVMYHAFKTLEYFEFKGSFTTMSAFMIDIMDPQILHLREILLLFVLNIVLNGLIIFYMSSIHPGKYGRRKNIFFLFSNILPFWRKMKPILLEDNTANIDNDFIEKVDNLPIGFRIIHLQKKYGIFASTLALNDVNLDIYIGDITVLLGHNGAGKTTLLNILTGMTAETGGYVLHNNVNVMENRGELDNIGYCAQQNVYFPYLTVKEHILFFGKLKGLSEYRAKIFTNELLRSLRMQEDAEKYVVELSTGTIRKLSLALAFIGYPKILILDEPTLGMDVQSRRRTWSLLKKIKTDRIIVITTQDMDEADILGDRIAIMHEGQVFCYGSGTGYTLILTKGEQFNTENVTAVITNVLPMATLQQDSDFFALYNLPIQRKFLFPVLFSTLEANQINLNISNMEVSYATMDQLFLNVTSLATKDTIKSTQGSPSRDDLPLMKRRGFELIFYQLLALLGKRFKLITRRYLRFIFCLFLAVILGMLNVKVIDWTYMILYDSVYPPKLLSVTEYLNAEIFVCEKIKSSLSAAYKNYVIEQEAILSSSDNCSTVQDLLLNFNERNPYEYKDNVIAAVELISNSPTVLYNLFLPHSAPVSMNLYSNALLRSVQNKNEETSITTFNEPFRVAKLFTFCSIDLQTTYTTAAFWWIFIYNSAIMTLFAMFIALIVTERIHGIKHMQTMSTLSCLLYWVGNFIFDYFYFSIIVLIQVTAMKVTDSFGIFQLEDLRILTIVLLWFGVSNILYSYIFATFFDTVSMFLLINIAMNICNAFTLAVFQLRDSPEYIIFEYISSLLPPFNFLNILMRYLFILLNNNHCVYCLDWELPLCKERTQILHYLKENHVENEPFRVQNILKLSIHQCMVYLGVDIIIYVSLLIVVNSGFSDEYWNKIMNMLFGKEIKFEKWDATDMDNLVADEKHKVKELVWQRDGLRNTLVVYNLRKNFLFGLKKFSAVKDINFSTTRGQCLGLVGINGSGKSTTFNILSADMIPTSGDVIIDDVWQSKDLNKYLSLIGYCPQTNAIHEELTAREMLHLLATLRGIRNPENHVEKWISILGIEHYQNRYIDTYSSGNKRKLCIALSMIGYPMAILLDEPTAGIDPASRRKIYRAIKHAKRCEQIIVFASHSLKECEDLCDRVIIIHSGMLIRIGTIGELKKMYASGYTLMVKLSNTIDYEKKTDLLIERIMATFGNICQLKDKRLGLLHFFIASENITWSKLFEAMEQQKIKNPIVDDYIISNATMEEAFISWTVF